ncbi:MULTISPECIES: PQQ-dependent sugar dehydrogenase [unclassified Streptomyces]|uniref:PQQ-dependent sugar dehydrogenase n=1 Tax=unclassified Streptomyces TaxID=2593676 RepID=UPI001E52F353|nr:PQQ-dependent sugar dehydrogenase [Streptomyces sp. CB02980]MCB8905145.1 PQQ-dependent sugar dehydrogenase [Streptomyces sp. CB02980]
MQRSTHPTLRRLRPGLISTMVVAALGSAALLVPPPATAATERTAATDRARVPDRADVPDRAAAPVRYEAESAAVSQGVVEANHAGFSGTGFVNGDNVAGSHVEFTVNAASAGTAVLAIRYANGTTTDRPATISVNGAVVAAARSFPSTGSWSGWTTATVTAPVTAGNNKIRLTSTTAAGLPNLDHLDVELTAPVSDYQAEDAAIGQGAVATNHTGYTGSGFVDYTNIAGSYVEFTVSAATAGSASLALQYANGTTATRPLDISVNGTVVASGVTFPSTGSWDTWTAKTVNAVLQAGTNKVRATATSADGGPNLDRLRVGTAADTTPPTRPGTPSCSAAGPNGLTLTWGAATDDVAVSAYDIYERGNKLAEAPGDTTAKALTGLAPGTTYNLTVIARDASGNASPASPAVDCATTPGTDPLPSRPGTPTVSAVTSTGATLTWGAATDDQGVVAYEIRSGAAVVATVTGTPPVTTKAVTGLACDAPFSLTVVAKDTAGGYSAASDPVSFTTGACADDGGVPGSPATLSSGWTIPWGVHWMPDGTSALVTERDSFKVYRLTPTGTKTQVGTVPNVVTTDGEGGLLGVAVDPDWSTNRHVYLMHTASEGNRIVRMTYNGTSLGGYTVLLQGIKKNRFHNGGRLAIGPDGFLYASTGDGQTPALAQDKNSLNGKILRLTTAGAPAPGNPFGNYVYSLGHRNPQGLAFDRGGRLWEAEFGDATRDELNLVKPGANYGWPTCEGTCGAAGMTDPKASWPVAQASPSGIAIVRNVVYMASLRGERMWRIPINGDTETVGTPTSYYVGSYGRLRTVTKVPGADRLWLTTTNADNNGGDPDGSDKIFRIDVG